jgi:cell fate (sporulation/competence/biofilm development) regulator YlbF (YheA/YmcA/DUF963 family)
MSIDTAVDADSTSEADATELASELGDAITQLPTYQRFLEAKEAVESDEEAQEKVRQFEELREDFMLARQTGNATNEDLRELQAAQEELHDVPVMSEFLEVQSELELELQELNEMISAPLALDFGEKAGGCCQD